MNGITERLDSTLTGALLALRRGQDVSQVIGRVLDHVSDVACDHMIATNEYEDRAA